MTVSLADKCKSQKGQAVIIAGVLVETILLIYTFVWNPNTPESHITMCISVDMLFVPFIGLLIWMLSLWKVRDPISNTGRILGMISILSTGLIFGVLQYGYISGQLLPSPTSLAGWWVDPNGAAPKLVTSAFIVFVVTGLSALAIGMKGIT